MLVQTSDALSGLFMHRVALAPLAVLLQLDTIRIVLVRIPVIRAVNVAGETAEDKESIRRQLESVLADEKTAGILFDGSSSGAGKTFDWSLLKNIQKTDKLLFLAGGLTPENAAQAVKTVAPDVVDVSSGVEKDVSPCAAFAGKDAEKITKFVENVRL